MPRECDAKQFSDPQAFAACLESVKFDRMMALEKSVATRDVDAVAQALRNAEAAHAAFEQEHGLDVDWPKFYAEYLLGVR